MLPPASEMGLVVSLKNAGVLHLARAHILPGVISLPDSSARLAKEAGALAARRGQKRWSAAVLRGDGRSWSAMDE